MTDTHEWRIGVDEAGYGPNLGPLVVAATAWRAPAGVELDEALAEAVTQTPGADGRLLIADSKTIYSPGGGLAGLERAVYAALGEAPGWSALLDRLGADPGNARAALPWHATFDPSAPRDARSEDIAAGAEALRRAGDASSIAAPRLAARLVFPAEFNDLVAEHGTKGAALSHLSIGLARRLVDGAGDERCSITFDKHGGRNRYAGLLQEHFPEGWIEVLDESRAISRYRQGERFRFEFLTGGESELPVALASMTAKLLRELAMQAFNAYWRQHVPNLRPTAGYPVDAKRFKAEIAAKQHELGVGDHILWRER